MLTYIILITCLSAEANSPNFVIRSQSQEFCDVSVLWAESYRQNLAQEWLGRALPNWSKPCYVVMTTGDDIKPGATTTFAFDNGDVHSWSMNIQGPMQDIVDSVLPHEIMHTILASYFRRPVPRWADEGIATMVEHKKEKKKHRRQLLSFLRSGRSMPTSELLSLNDYPNDMLQLYAQGFSMTEYLVSHGGKEKFIRLLISSRDTTWQQAIATNYGILDITALQDKWLEWVISQESANSN